MTPWRVIGPEWDAGMRFALTSLNSCGFCCCLSVIWIGQARLFVASWMGSERLGIPSTSRDMLYSEQFYRQPWAPRESMPEPQCCYTWQGKGSSGRACHTSTWAQWPRAILGHSRGLHRLPVSLSPPATLALILDSWYAAWLSCKWMEQSVQLLMPITRQCCMLKICQSLFIRLSAWLRESGFWYGESLTTWFCGSLLYVIWQEISVPEISCRFQSILKDESEVWASVSGADLSWGPIRIDLFYIHLYILYMYPRSWSESCSRQEE